MFVFQVGKLYSSSKTAWPQSVEYNYRDSSHELRLFLRSPNKAEIADVKSGQAKFSFSIHGDAIAFCFRFGAMPWSDSLYSIHLVPEVERVPPQYPLKEGKGALLTVFLIDAENGMLEVMRAIALPHQFSNHLHYAIIEQLERPFDRDAYDRQCDQIYAKFPTSDELAAVGVLT